MSVHEPADHMFEFDGGGPFASGQRTPIERIAPPPDERRTEERRTQERRTEERRTEERRGEAPPTGLVKVATGPRYLAIAKLIEREIRDGMYHVGEMLPTEAQLVRRFEVSRFTVREALRLLEATALVRRKQGAGTIVEATEPTERFTQRLQSLRQVLQYPQSRLEVDRVAKVRLTRADARLLDVEPGETWVKATGKRRATGSGQLVCTTTIWLPPAFASMLQPGRAVEGSVHTRLEQSFGVRIERVDVSLTATVLSEGEARLLGRQSPAAAMIALRRYADRRGATLQMSSDCHPAENFSYRVQFERERAPE